MHASVVHVIQASKVACSAVYISLSRGPLCMLEVTQWQLECPISAGPLLQASVYSRAPTSEALPNMGISTGAASG